MKKLTAFFLLLVFIFSTSCEELESKTKYVVLTWTKEDTSRTMAINYRLSKKSKKPTAHYDLISHGGDPTKYQFKAKGDTKTVLGLKGSYFHQVEISELTPNTTYYFVVGDKESGYSKERKFRTLPSDDSEINFVNGGDMGVGPLLAPLLKLAAKENPHFALIGGDIAYGNGDIKRWANWIAWLQNWDQHMVTPDGHSIPFIAAVGNHEVKKVIPVAPFFTKVLRQSKRSYFLRKVGSDKVFYILDTGHLSWQVGPQRLWMKRKFKKYKDLRYRFAAYHIPLYPSHRDYDLFQAKVNRYFWAPLFEKYKIHTGFEHHDHTMKRTHYIKDGKVVGENEGGILYIGDGCFGRDRREAYQRWYLAKSVGIEHFWSVTVNAKKVRYHAIDLEGNTVDDYLRMTK